MGLCVCKRQYVEGENMICCDGCNTWFHPDCVGMSKEELAQREQLGEDEKWYHSAECKQKSLSAPSNQFTVPNFVSFKVLMACLRCIGDTE